MRLLNDMAPNFPNPYVWLGYAYLEKKDYGAATKALQKAVELSGRAPVPLAALGTMYARAGQMQKAEQIVSELLETSKKRYVPEFNMVFLYTAMGQKDEAFAWLEKSYQERSNGLSAMRVYPLIDDLRSDPLYVSMLHRMKLD
jgi:Flp pilus assembly protein TadD